MQTLSTSNIFAEIEKSIHKVHMQSQGTPNSQNQPENNKADFKMSLFQNLLHKAMVIKTAWCWNQNKHIEQRNRVECYKYPPHKWLIHI